MTLPSDQEAAAFWGSANNPAYTTEQRLSMALQALEFFGHAYDRLTQSIVVTDRGLHIIVEEQHRDVAELRAEVERLTREAANASRDHIAEVQAMEARQAQVWQEGYTSGHSRAMRRMSDEPDVEPGTNPYLELCGLQGHQDEGFCTCTKPKGHTPPHACQHGGWR